MKSKQQGFTIIELLIAMVVFSVVLLMVTFAIININTIYYKGLTNSKTQEAARSIIQDVSQAIQFNGGKVVSGYVLSDPDFKAHCIGNRRYSYVLNAPSTGLVAVNIAGCDATKPNLTAGSGTQLLGENMRLSKFEVTNPSPNFYRVTVKVIYGDDDLLIDTTTPSDGIYDQCDPAQRAGTQFCAVSELSTVVQQRVQ